MVDTILGDGSFADCVRIASVIDGNLVLDKSQLEQSQVEEAVASSLIPQNVVEYVASCESAYLRMILLHDRSFSDGFVSRFLREQLRVNEIPVALHRSLIANSQFLNGMREYLRLHKLFEQSGYASGRFSYSSSTQNTFDNKSTLLVDKARIWWAEKLSVSAQILEELSLCSVAPLEVLEKCSGFDTEPAVLSHLFFNKNLTVDDVNVLLENMPLSCGGNVWDIRQLLLFIAVLLREDWTADEMRFLYEEWLKFVEKVEEGLSVLEANSAPVLEFVSASKLLRDFQALVPEVNTLFATNKATPHEVLMKVFAHGNMKVRAAVVQNVSVGQEFAQAVLEGDVGVIYDMCSTSVSEDNLSDLREHVVWNPVLSFSELEKVYGDETEDVSMRFGALFNENVPSFMRSLYW